MKGGEVGTATAADVLAPKTIGTDSGIVTGSIPTQGNQFKSGLWSNPDGDAYVDSYVNIDSGYYPPGSQVTIQVHDPDLLSGNIRAGADVFGVPGKSTVVDTADAVLDPQYLLVGQSGYDDGVKKDGQMPNRSAENNHMPGLESTVWAGDRFFIQPPHGYFNGSTWVTAAVPGLTANNLRAGVNVAGLVGTLVEGKPFASGSAIVKGRSEFMLYGGGRQDTAYIEVNGLAFVPKRIVVYAGFVSALYIAETGMVGILENAWNNGYGNYFIYNALNPSFTIPVSSKSSSTVGSTVYWEVYG